MKLINILFSSAQEDNHDLLTDTAKTNIRRAKNVFPDLDHEIYNIHRFQDFLIKSYPKNVSKCFDSLIPFAYKADLAKYCLLYYYGGIASDISYYICSRFCDLGEKPCVFRDFMNTSPWDTSVGLIYAPPKSRFLLNVINQICSNVENKYYGINPLCPTGPALFGKIFASFHLPGDFECGEAKMKTFAYIKRKLTHNNLKLKSLNKSNKTHCLFLSGELVAIKIKPGGSGTETLFKGGSNYNQYWHSRTIYKE